MAHAVEGSSAPEKTTDEVIWLDPQKPWFLLEEDSPAGPFTLAELRAAMESGRVRGASFLWQEGLVTWTRADSLERLGLLWEAAATPDLREGRRPTRDTALVTLIASRKPSETTETRVERRLPKTAAPASDALTPVSPPEQVVALAGVEPSRLALSPLGWIAVGVALASSIHFLALLWWTAR